MKKSIITTIFLVFVIFLSNAQIITNNGAKVRVSSNVHLMFNSLHNTGANAAFYYDSPLSVTGNWINDAPAIFEHGSNGTLTFNGTGQQTVKSSGSDFRKLTVNNSSGLNDAIVLSDNMQILQELTLTNGIMSFADPANKLIIGPSATTNQGNTNSFVDGIVEKTSCSTAGIVIPTGDIISRDIGAGTQTYKIWAPIALTPESPSTVNAKYLYSEVGLNTWWYHDWTHQTPLTHTSGLEYWLVNSSVNTTVTLYWKNNNPCNIHGLCDILTSQFYDGNLTVAYWNNIWKDAGGNASTDSENGSITSGVIPFGAKSEKQITFGAKNKNVPLPVSLISFEGKCSGNEVNLNWQTASETNNRGFVIEKSFDAKNFNRIGFVEGNGNSNQMLNYAFTDENSERDGAYYRLKQLDYDGAYKYSKSIFAHCDKSEYEPILSIYPNPFRQDVTIVVSNLPKGDKTEVCIYNMHGVLIYKTMPTTIDGSFKLNVNLEYLPPAMYVVKVISSNYVEVFRLEKN